MRIVEGFILREIMDEIIAVPGGKAVERISGLVSLNGTGAFLFRKLQTEQTPESLTAAMQEEYEVDEATAAADVQEFLDLMREANLLVEE